MTKILTEWITQAGNLLGLFLIIYYILDTLRNWEGTPLEKTLKDELHQLNSHIELLIRILDKKLI